MCAHPAEQEFGHADVGYRAELYDEVVKTAQELGFKTVQDALQSLKSHQQGHTLHDAGSGAANAKDEEILAIHRKLAAAELHARLGWERYEAANRDRNSLREALAKSAVSK